MIGLSWDHTSCKMLLISCTLSGRKIRGTYAAPITWDCFSETFLDKFFLIELREAKALEFMNLR